MNDTDIKRHIKNDDDFTENKTIEKKKKRFKRIIRIIVIFFILALIIVGIGFYLTLKNKIYKDYEVLATTVRTDGNTVVYKKISNHIMKYSRDGAAAIGRKGEMLWNESFAMKNPKGEVCGTYATVADIKGNSIYVFDKNGKVSEIETLLPIVHIKIASQGVVAAVLEDTNAYYIKVYNKEGTELLTRKTQIEKDGYPITIAISPDGLKLITSYLSVKNAVVENFLTCYNLDEVGKGKEDNIVGAVILKSTIIAKIEFLDNNTFCAYGDNKFSIYSMREIPKLIHEEEYTEEVRSIFSDNNHIGFVFQGLGSDDKYKLSVYNLKGKKVLEKNINFEYTNISISGENIILNNELECIIMNINGVEKFNYSFGKTINYIFPVNGIHRYILIDEVLIEEIRLK